MVYCIGVSHTIYGVIPMTREFLTSRRSSSKENANILNFLMFLTGAVLGCLVVKCFGLESVLLAGNADPQEFSWSSAVGASFPTTLLINGKFLILLFLFAFLRCGAALIPPLFGAEGAFLGAAFASVISAMGRRGALLLAILLIFRLTLVLPYGFLLGVWSVEHSLSFETLSDVRRQKSVQICFLTLLVLVAASFLECTLARWLGGIYFLKFGV